MSSTPTGESLLAVNRRIAEAELEYGRLPGSVRLLAVSKGHSSTDIRAAAAAGQRRFGESYSNEALAKIEALGDLDLEWHFIGPIQSNKTRDIAARFAWVHSIDRLKIARRLSEQRPEDLPSLQVCIQVNVSAEPSKSGISPSEASEFVLAVSQLPRLQVRGLMTLPAPDPELASRRQAFGSLRAIRDSLVAEGLPLDTLSMGMSDDLEAAIAEGATLVRVGVGVFGQRSGDRSG